MVFMSNVTEAVLASTLPVTVAPVVTVTEVEASMLPKNSVLVPRVAELPTRKNTLQA
jgi:purine nucleoside phosphorylase